MEHEISEEIASQPAHESSINLDDLARGGDTYEVAFTYRIQTKSLKTGRLIGADEGRAILPLTWDEIFKAIGPDLLHQGERWTRNRYGIYDLIADRSREALKQKHPKAEVFINYRLTPECKETIYMQFRTLKLIELDKERNWVLTAAGDDYLANLFAVRKK